MRLKILETRVYEGETGVVIAGLSVTSGALLGCCRSRRYCWRLGVREKEGSPPVLPIPHPCSCRMCGEDGQAVGSWSDARTQMRSWVQWKPSS